MNTESQSINDKTTLAVKMALSAWESQYARVSKLIESLSDEQLQADTAPGRNSGSYIVGHLLTVTDAMLPLLEFGQKLHPELEEVYIKRPDKSGLPTPSVAQLRTYWNEVHSTLSKHFAQLSPEAWFTRHTAVSESDFIKEPHRNKLNLLINRTNHMGYHFGQLIYLTKK